MRKVREDMPIILLSAYSDREKLLQAIDIGINKYMIKPVDPEELLKLVFEILKQDNLIQLLKPYLFNIKKKILYHDSHIVNLTKKELFFVTLLSRSAGEIVPKEKLKSYIWGQNDLNDTLLRALVKRFRAKTDKQLVENCQGLGYKISISE
jgi:DNA-binding response OmpR family regulator